MNKQPLHVYFALCIFIRLLLIYFAFIFLHNNIGNTLFTLLYALMGISILYQYLSKIRTKGAFGQDIWWDFLRPLHAVLFLCANFIQRSRNPDLLEKAFSFSSMTKSASPNSGCGILYVIIPLLSGLCPGPVIP